jgi:hypothetical protein
MGGGAALEQGPWLMLLVLAVVFMWMLLIGYLTRGCADSSYSDYCRRVEANREWLKRHPR